MPDSDSEYHELDPLLARLVDGTITLADMEKLELQLDGDPAAQRRYLHYLDLHADLATGERSSGDQIIAPSENLRWRRWLAAGLATAAAITLTLALLFRDSGSPTPVIRVVDLDGPVSWIGDGHASSQIKVGDTLPAGTLETLAPDSSAEVEFTDGSSISLAGHSSIAISQVDGQKILRLPQGNLSIEAAKQPIGLPMRIVTPSAQAEVLGTQFNVAADEFSARFVVNEGLVRVTRLADGKVEEVAAEEMVVAALEQGTDFTASPRRAFVESWKSELPRDRLQGQWESGSTSNSGCLRAMPHLWKGERGLREEPVLLYTAVLDPSAGRRPPLRLSEKTRLTIRGRLDREHRIDVGFGTNRTRGGPVAKYAVNNGIVVGPDEDGRFSVELDLATFQPMREHFPDSLAGQEVDWLWIQTVKVDAGLVIESVELAR